MAPQLTPAPLFGAERPAIPHGGKKPSGWRTASRTLRIITLPVAASLVFLVAHRTAAAEGTQGAQLAATCASCHRLDGRDEGIPSVVGLDEKSLAGAMFAYKSGERQSMIMHAVAASLSSEEIGIVAHYLAAQGKRAKQQ